MSVLIVHHIPYCVHLKDTWKTAEKKRYLQSNGEQLHQHKINYNALLKEKIYSAGPKVRPYGAQSSIRTLECTSRVWDSWYMNTYTLWIRKIPRIGLWIWCMCCFVGSINVESWWQLGVYYSLRRRTLRKQFSINFLDSILQFFYFCIRNISLLINRESTNSEWIIPQSSNEGSLC